VSPHHLHVVHTRYAGLVLALNARCLAINPGPFHDFLSMFPRSSILAWTGSGEPCIPIASIESIRKYFEEQGMGDRISFDCDVDTSC